MADLLEDCVAAAVDAIVDEQGPVWDEAGFDALVAAARPRLTGVTAQVMQDVLLAAQPTKEFVTPEQVAALALFLCRDEAAAITGANLSMDGGWTAA